MKNNKSRLRDRPRTNAKRSNMAIDDQSKSKPTPEKYKSASEKAGGGT